MTTTLWLLAMWVVASFAFGFGWSVRSSIEYNNRQSRRQRGIKG
jgi:hypothetical protein